MTNAFGRRLGVATLCSGLIAWPPAAMAAGASTEIMTAATHAGFSASATSVQMAQAHLHHTLNCLVGPGGSGFDPAALNPCKNSGNGAIPDTADAAKKSALEEVAFKARAALADNDLTSVQKKAAEIEAELKKLK